MLRSLVGSEMCIRDSRVHGGNRGMDYLRSYEQLAALGLTLSVKTVTEDSFIGEVFYFDLESRILILKLTIADSNKYDYIYLNTDKIKEYKILNIRDITVELLCIVSLIREG
eukprot:TRINITY_DN1210_c0_g1_i19.p1 TRINITY_DN1210_c0_g1~~TRINITY_DN1210_c0_g1_i19.p1  ORF type:complete len:112 (-),score=23.85 TRINITY_DN1210_c0_g1_i19:421-756(-)